MFILSALLQAVIVSIVVIIVLLIPIFFILGKFKNKDKISLKGVKTVVFNLNELVEDYMISTVSINKTLFAFIFNLIDLSPLFKEITLPFSSTKPVNIHHLTLTNY